MVDTAPRTTYIGASTPKVDGVDKVTGAARYGADMRLPGMLEGRILRSPHAHARIKRIDTSKAEAAPGVMAVVTGKDFPTLKPGSHVQVGVLRLDMYRISHNAIAREKVVYAGQPVAAVAATTPEAAQAALALIEVEYEVLPHVIDEVAAMRVDAPLLHDDLFTSGAAEKPTRPSNVALYIEMGRGDVAKGESEAEVVIERSFKTQMVHQGYLEPEAETAWWQLDGRLTVWADTQGPFGQRAQLSAFLGVPQARITVVPMEVGGGFGAKNALRLAPLCAGLSRKSGRPVRIVLSRDEVLRATGPGVATTTFVRVGARKDGTITLIDARMVYNAGAFPGSPLAGGTLVGFSAYQTPNLRIVGYDVVTNRPKVQAYRAPGGPPISFAVESVMDEVAERIGMDPVALRIKNASRTGDPGPNDLKFNRIGLADILERVADHPAWTGPVAAPKSGGKVGRGVALGYWRGGTNTSSCELNLHGDGSISLVTGSVDLSSARTAFSQIVADQFGITPADVTVSTGDTNSVGYTDNSGGSRVTYVTGTAVFNACQAAISILKSRAAQKLGVTADVVEFAAGVFSARDIQDKRVTLKELASDSVRGSGVISTSGTATGMQAAPAFAAHVADVEVDPDTGKIQILRFTAFQDVGKAINRAQVEGQIQGGVAQGVGWAVHEAYVWDDKGTLRNASLLDYRMPTALDLPAVDVELIETPASDGPFGVRGVGEVPIVPPPGALANAIYRAVGVRMDVLPMNPESVLSAIKRRARPPARNRWLKGVGAIEASDGGAVAGVDTPNDE
ncbi:MAG: xanthine dehydrogenase family protein molybdopterin-binding subunit [SAR202 cluster bacterium]|nr:xanthine dehydrogenase family protein molybdopterin-binding subunit [SAR202 cluster bacterium]